MIYQARQLMCSPSIETLEPRRLLATTYYVSATGSDSFDGKSTLHPFRTIARVNKLDLNPGDKVLFEGGKTFSASGSVSTNLLSNSSFESNFTSWGDTLGTAAGNSAID